MVTAEDSNMNCLQSNGANNGDDLEMTTAYTKVFGKVGAQVCKL